MKTRHLILFSILAILSIAAWKPLFVFSDIASTSIVPMSNTQKHFAQSIHTAATETKTWIEQKTKVITAQAHNLSPQVLKVGLTAYLNARKKGLSDKPMMTLVDYSKASNERRLWVIDLKNEKVLFNTYVAHGKNSGDVNSTSFSNQPSSLKTSLGVFTTDEIYEGHHGTSLRIKGQEPGFNDKALSRDIVFHGAWYVSPEVAKERGRLGRSWGCLAVDEKTIKPLINTIKDKTVVVAYYPDKTWLKKSEFLKMQAA